MSDDIQQEVIEFLERPATHGGVAVKRVDTHAAVVFLAGDRVLKIKRAVRFPFLDYSTLQKRRAACAAEIEVNRPFAPAIYRGVAAVTRETDGTLAIDGAGETVEYAVDMRRFDETQTLDRLAAEDRIDDTLADALARAVVRAHGTVPADTDAGFVAVLSDVIAQNDAELGTASDLFPPRRVDDLTRATQAALKRTRPLLEARERAGLVRRCHGDLHLGNIVLLDGAPVLFDAIEFDPNIATGDVLYDLAFLLMDLIERGLATAANIVLNRYLTETRRMTDFDALAALPLFLSLRAAIRAKVAAERRKQHRERAEAEQSARVYFALAERLIHPTPPALVAVGGLSGTGKTVLARKLAAAIPPAPGAVVLRSDVERKALFKVGEIDRLPESAYATDANTRVYDTLAEKAGRILAAGHSAIVDAVYARPAERNSIARAASGGTFRGLFLTADASTRIGRVSGRTGDASDAGGAIARAQEQYEIGAIDWTLVDASGTPDDTLHRAKTALHLT